MLVRPVVPSICALLAASAAALPAQESLSDVTSTPEAAAALFLRSVRAIRWSATAQLVHPETLERFRTTVTLMSDADASGQLRAYLTDTDSTAYLALDAPEVFERAVGAMVDDMPGLMHALYDREDEVLGHVPEGDTLAHAVYRTTARISGAISQVEVMQEARTNEGWRVLWSTELEVLDAALRGVPRGRLPPPGGQSGPQQPPP